MAPGTLYTYPNNFRAYKILIAAQFSNSEINVVSEPPKFVFGETNKTASFLKKFPVGKVPAFETSDGKYIFESNAIAHFVGNDQLRGKDALTQALIVQWINFADNEILPSACAWVFPTLSIIQPNKQAVEHAKQVIPKLLTILDKHLLTRTWLVGERITQADIAVLANLVQLFEHVLEPEIRKPFVNVIRWFTTLINQPQVKAVIGEFKFCVKALQFDAKTFAGFQKCKEAGDAKERKNSDKKDKKEKTKEKPKKVEPDEEMDESDAILAAESSSKDPFAVYPKGNFNMDDFKRVYSNEDEKVSVPYFWQKFDKDHYSIWYCEYKFPAELTQVFMSCNLISGMFQRLDKMRKNAFGSMILFGSDNNSTISGIWIWKGHDLAFPLSPDWTIDYESYEWKKLDPEVDDTKKMVNEYMSWSGDFGGRKFNQGKIFK